MVRLSILGVMLAASALLPGCGSAPARVSPDPLIDVTDRSLEAHVRIAAVDRARAQAGNDTVAIGATQRAFRDVAWSANEPVALRLAVLTSMINDPDPGVATQARETARLLLPRDGDRDVVVYLSKTAAERGWTDFIPPLIRSYSRPMTGVPDAQRAERRAISDLSAGRDVERVVFDVFLKPPPLEPTYGLDWAQRFRADAWDLLGRLDADGALRIRLLAEQSMDDGGDEVVREIRRCVKDLRSLPITGDELKWLLSLRDPNRPENIAWWSEAAAAVAAVPDKGPLSMRHAEPIRWASRHRPEWLSASRDELLSQLRTRLTGRRFHSRSIESHEFRPRESLEHSHARLRWADLVTILVLDEAIHQASIGAAFGAQTAMDRKDESTEYGGVLLFKPDPAPGNWVCALFPPRPGQRQGDDRFIASNDMLAASDAAAAHYHFHAQRTRNVEYAGPSTGDLVYAARLGRSCLVLTSVDSGVMSVDFYQPDGIVVDLGEIRTPLD